ncbi:MAG: acetaldehyde dehydrogenase (acetylating), partial [Myxococcota bacterium]
MSVGCAILGSGNIGTDLMFKVLRQRDPTLTCVAMVGIDPDSDGLARARKQGVWTTHNGIAGLVESEVWASISVVFDATSAGAHRT